MYFGCFGFGLDFDLLVSWTAMQLFFELEQNRTVVTFLSSCYWILNNVSTLDAYCDHRHHLFYDYCSGRDYSELSHSKISKAVLYRVSEFG